MVGGSGGRGLAKFAIAWNLDRPWRGLGHLSIQEGHRGRPH